MALYTSKGRISDMSEVQSGTSQSGYEWQRMTIVLEIPGFQGSVTKQAFQVNGDSVKDVLLFSIGDQVEVSWAMYARQWNGKWYNNVDLVKIKYQERVSHDQGASVAPAQAAPQQMVIDDASESGDPKDDLPF